jgi:diguanylate cyclase (GGDEF)-like protein
VQYLNRVAEGLTEMRRDRARGRRAGSVVRLVNEVTGKLLPDPVAACLHERRSVSVSGLAMLGGQINQHPHFIRAHASPVRDRGGAVVGVVLVLHDLTELQGPSGNTDHQTSHDALTGLCNRRGFSERLDAALESVRRGGRTHVLACLDLDRFKLVNETSGREAGDALIREVADLLGAHVGSLDLVGRMGSDDFAVLLYDSNPARAAAQIDGILKTLRSRHFYWDEDLFDLGMSAGLVRLTGEFQTADDALAAGDTACHVARRLGRNRLHWYAEHDEAVASRRGEVRLHQQIQQALASNRFRLFVQPVVPVDGDRASTGFDEVLLRMIDADGRVIAPDRFVPTAERYNLMPELDRWVVENALDALGRPGSGLAEVGLCAINLSGQTLGDEDFLDFVVGLLDRTGVSPARLCFEITETAVITNFSRARRFINVLRGMGCKFALDDFGSGLSSFAYLKNLNMDMLKIDGSFIRDLVADTVDHAMVGLMVELGRIMGIRIVAEHVESKAVLEAVRRLGVDFVQGFAIEEPRPV